MPRRGRRMNWVKVPPEEEEDATALSQLCLHLHPADDNCLSNYK